MKQAFIKDRKGFDKVAEKYGFVKTDIGEVYEKWYKRIGKVELYVFDRSNEINISEKGISRTKGKKHIEKYIEDILHLIEWR